MTDTEARDQCLGCYRGLLVVLALYAAVILLWILA